MTICSFSDCNREIVTNLKFLHGKPYCDLHYFNLLGNELKSAFQNWNDAPKNFIYYLARCSDEENWKTRGDSYLTQGRINDRAFNFKKIDNGCEFDIIRHLNAWEGRKPYKEVIEHWKADISNKTLELMNVKEIKPKK